MSFVQLWAAGAARATPAGTERLTGPVCAAAPNRDTLVCRGPVLPQPADYGIYPLSEARRAKMVGVTWHEGCPVGLKDLAVVVVPYLDPGGVPRVGTIVIARQHAKAVLLIFQQLFEKRFPIAHMKPIDAFGGNDEASMTANNTTGFNCRKGPRMAEWSEHARGDAIDLNPFWNPQIRGAKVAPPSAIPWAVRGRVRAGMAVPGGAAPSIFRAQGWHWGGRWPNPKDYQHFSVSGR